MATTWSSSWSCKSCCKCNCLNYLFVQGADPGSRYIRLGVYQFLIAIILAVLTAFSFFYIRFWYSSMIFFILFVYCIFSAWRNIKFGKILRENHLHRLANGQPGLSSTYFTNLSNLHNDINAANRRHIEEIRVEQNLAPLPGYQEATTNPVYVTPNDNGEFGFKPQHSSGTERRGEEGITIYPDGVGASSNGLQGYSNYSVNYASAFDYGGEDLPGYKDIGKNEK